MKRRDLIRYSLLGAGSLAVSTNGRQMRAIASVDPPIYDWILLYWMPYDNDLSRFGRDILQMLENSVQSDNILVVVEADFSHTRTLSRYVITHEGMTRYILDTSDSSSDETLANYLNWARSAFTSRHWVVTFLGHGGILDELSPDDKPDLRANSSRTWMKLDRIQEHLTAFNAAIDDRLELLFFQNCNKSAIEVLYTVKDVAPYTLASQMLLGAPNYYYEGALPFLAANPNIDGVELAAKIIESEARSMYHSYSAIDNRSLDEFPDKLDPLIASILEGRLDAIDLDTVVTYNYSGDRFVDLVEFFQTLAAQTEADPRLTRKFVEFCQEKIVREFDTEGELWTSNTRSSYQHFSGLGLFLPETPADLDRYRSLPIYTDTALPDLFAAIFNSEL